MSTKTAAIIGGGVIGGGWAARFLLNGWNVRIYDPAPDASRKLDEVLANCLLYTSPSPRDATLSRMPSSA